MRRVALVLTLVLGAVTLAGTSPAAAAGAPASQVSVVHGLRGLVADISVDGKVVLQGFGAERSTDPLPMSAGPHLLQVRRSGTAGPPVISTTLTVPAGQNISLVAHLDPANTPVLTPFVNDATAVPAGQGRLVARNTAAAASVQFVVDGQPLGGAAASGAGNSQDLPPGEHTVSVQAPGGGQELLGAQTVQVPAGQTTANYLNGSPADGSLGWLVQTVKIVAGTPGGVPTGNSGLKDRPTGAVPASVPALLLVGLAGTVGAALRRRVW